MSQLLIKSAILGTSSSPVQIPDDIPQEILKDIPSPEGQILAAAGIRFLQKRAGWQPEQDDLDLPDPAEADDLPPAPADSVHYLQHTINDRQLNALIPQWFEALQKTGKRVPEEGLHLVLNLGVNMDEQADLVEPFLGHRGHWLAENSGNSRWKWARRDIAPETIWAEGKLKERLYALQQLRRRNPAQARELLQSTWQQESPKAKSAFLQALAINLSMDDEPFLESLLTEKIPYEVRYSIVELLTALPESRLVQRMIQRVEPYFNIKDRKWHMNLPQTLDEAAIRDGVQKEDNNQVNSPLWWMQQMLASIPPSYWCKKWNLTPAELIRQLPRNPHIFEGLAWATRRTGDAGMAEALLAVLPEVSPESTDLVEKLNTVLPDDHRKNFLIQQIKKAPVTLIDLSDSLMFLQQYEQVWSKALSEALLRFLEQLRRKADKAKAVDTWGTPLANPDFIALYIHPAYLVQTRQFFENFPSGNWQWENAKRGAIKILDFRQEMLKVIFR